LSGRLNGKRAKNKYSEWYGNEIIVWWIWKCLFEWVKCERIYWKPCAKYINFH